jgi:light-regulated signal transduction histidine kinase (bacteriophytochrome)
MSLFSIQPCHVHHVPKLLRARTPEQERVMNNELFQRSSNLFPRSLGPLKYFSACSTNPVLHTVDAKTSPFHIPGAIQSFGALLGLKYNDGGQLEVRIASENSRKILGYGPEQLFVLPSFLDVLKHDVRDEMVARIKHALSTPDAMKEETRLDVFQMIFTFPYEPDLRLWCAIHLASSPEGVVICEFEEYANAFCRKDVGAAKIMPATPVSLEDLEISPEEWEKSTTSASKPLPVIEISRRKHNKEFSSLDLFNAMSQAQQQLSSCRSIQTLLEVAVGIISELTGFHRVMAYRFDSQKNGCIDAEILNPHACTDIFRGKSIANALVYLIANS